jgi:hypothetical protein
MTLDIDFTRRNKKPRPLSEHEKEKLDEFVDAIHYSARFVVYHGTFDARVADQFKTGTQTTNTNTATCSFRSRC